MFADIEKIRNWFDRYVHSFDLSAPMIRMKYDHSYEVMRLGERLTDSLPWSAGDRQAGVAACLLHDTGRFSQYRDFGTYYDGASTDHGDRGYEVLSAEFPRGGRDTGAAPIPAALLDKKVCLDDEVYLDKEVYLDDEAYKVILQAVKWHNKKNLPELEPEFMPFCRLARDADKLDVFALVQRRMDEGTVGELLPGHAVDAPLSEKLLNEVQEHWSGSYKHASSLQDFLLIQLTWVLDMNFAPSVQILEESGVLRRIRERFSDAQDNARVQAVLDGLFTRIDAHKKFVTVQSHPKS